VVVAAVSKDKQPAELLVKHLNSFEPGAFLREVEVSKPDPVRLIVIKRLVWKDATIAARAQLGLVHENAAKPHATTLSTDTGKTVLAYVWCRGRPLFHFPTKEGRRMKRRIALATFRS